MRLRAAFLCFAITLASGAACAQSLVYRVDRATAVVNGGYLVVHVKGAARTGGWAHPRLIERRSPGSKSDIEFHFMATPPANASAVVQQVVPVNVSLKTRAPARTVAAVRVVSQTNAVTAQIRF